LADIPKPFKIKLTALAKCAYAELSVAIEKPEAVGCGFSALIGKISVTRMAVQSFRNRLLHMLDPFTAAQLRPLLVQVPLVARTILEYSGEQVRHVYFPESGVVSTVVRGADGRAAEAGITGHEGVTGTSVLLGDDRSPCECIVQLTGEAWRIETGDYLKFLNEHPDFRALLLRFVHTFLIQTGQSSLAAAKSKLEERLSRWLLMVQDRAGGPRLELTHEFMALMLGTRRAGVTMALHELEGKALVKSTRGAVAILDRRGLKEMAGQFYGVAEAEYRRIMKTEVSAQLES
jgi:CRP-like cAMP-binding protein